MKIAVIGDQHYGVRNDSAVFYDYQKMFNDVFFKTIDEENIETVIHVGDLYDRRKYINFLTLDRSRQDFLHPLDQRNLDVHVIAGNHDIYYKNTNEVNSLVPLLKGYDFNVYLNATEIHPGDGTPILLVPWICDVNREHTMKTISETKAQIAFGHFELSGFEMEKGIVSESETTPESLNLNKFDIVASGHYHHKSQKDNILYLGAAYEFRWSDYNDPRGFHIFDTDTREFTFYQNPYTMFEMINYNDERDKDEIEAAIRLGKKFFSKFHNRYVRIIVSKRTNPYLFDLFFDALYAAQPIHISIIEQDIFLDDETDDLDQKVKSTIMVINDYIDELNLNNMNPDLLKTEVKEIYDEAILIDESIDE